MGTVKKKQRWRNGGDDGMSANSTTIPDVLISLASPSVGGAVGPPPPRRRLVASTGIMTTSSRERVEEVLIFSGLVAVQVVNAAYMVLLAPILNVGIKPLLFIIFGNLTTSALVSPFAVAFERRKWPPRISFILMSQLLFIALGGVTVFQKLLLVGLKKTSPAIASAMPNIAPGVIFLIAACLGFEKVDIRCKYTLTKIIGTMACLSGAVAMSFLQSPSAAVTAPSLESTSKDWLIGCLCLLGGVLVVSCTTVLQAAVMVQFPAPFTLCAITSSLGAFATAVVEIISDGGLNINGSPAINIWIIVAVILLGGILTASCLAFQAWCVQKKGPVLVSMFSPIQTVCSAILSALLLGDVINLGSIAGMILMFLGLYIVLWAKKKEDIDASCDDDANARQPIDDIENPLLS